MATPCTRLKIDSSGVKMEHGSSVTEPFSAACLARSKLLQDLLGQCEDTGEATLPVAEGACLEWARYVNHKSGAPSGGRSPARRPGSPARLSTDADTADPINATHLTPAVAVDIPTSGLCRLLLVRLPPAPRMMRHGYPSAHQLVCHLHSTSPSVSGRHYELLQYHSV